MRSIHRWFQQGGSTSGGSTETLTHTVPHPSQSQPATTNRRGKDKVEVQPAEIILPCRGANLGYHGVGNSVSNDPVVDASDGLGDIDFCHTTRDLLSSAGDPVVRLKDQLPSRAVFVLGLEVHWIAVGAKHAIRQTSRTGGCLAIRSCDTNHKSAPGASPTTGRIAPAILVLECGDVGARRHQDLGIVAVQNTADDVCVGIVGYREARGYVLDLEGSARFVFRFAVDLVMIVCCAWRELALILDIDFQKPTANTALCNCDEAKRENCSDDDSVARRHVL